MAALAEIRRSADTGMHPTRVGFYEIVQALQHVVSPPPPLQLVIVFSMPSLCNVFTCCTRIEAVSGLAACSVNAVRRNVSACSCALDSLVFTEAHKILAGASTF